MKTYSTGYFFAMTGMFFISLVLHGCSDKGCTNPLAVNYDVTADEDDGSCILCNTTSTRIGELTDSLAENNFSSPFYHDTVARFTVYQDKFDFSSGICGQESATISLRVESLLDTGMIINYRVNSTGPVNINRTGIVTLNRREIQEQGVYVTSFSPPIMSIDADSSTFSVFINGANISYF